jgi:hypothetical protein
MFGIIVSIVHQNKLLLHLDLHKGSCSNNCALFNFLVISVDYLVLSKMSVCAGCIISLHVITVKLAAQSQEQSC